MRRILITLFLGGAFLHLNAQFTAGRLVVSRIGDGTTTLTAGTSVPISLYEFTPTDANQVIPASPATAIGSSTSGSRLTVTGNGKGEGVLSLSANNQYLNLIGYDQSTGATAVTCNAGNKVIGRVNAAGVFEYSTSFPSSAAGIAKCVATTDGNNYYTNINDLGYIAWNQTTAPANIASPGSNLIYMGVAAGQLYFYTSYGNINYTTPALPVSTAATAAELQLSVSLDGRSFAFLNTDNNTSTGYTSAGYDVLYLANRINGLEKYYYVPATATAAAKWLPANAQFQLKGNITNGGTGYTSAPTVTIGTAWTSNTAYAVNSFVTNTVSGTSRLYYVKTAGTSGTTGPTHTSGDATDGTAVLTAVGFNTTATTTINGGVVTDITLKQGNAQQAPVSPYNMVAPAISISGGGGSGATATASYPSVPVAGSVAAITAAMVNGQPVVYAITGDGTSSNNKVIAITDGSGSISSAMTSGNSPAVTLATAGANYAFRGVSLAPVTVVLPLELTSFNGNLVNNKAVLRWTTTAEVNAQSFIVERSAGNNAFAAIGTVAAKNNPGENDYTYTDEQPATGINYYRLKLVDKDGSAKYSTVVALNLSAGIKKMSVFPNPVVNSFTLTHPPATTNTFIQVMTVAGKLVAQYTVSANATQTSMDASRLMPGQYIIRYVNGQEVTSLSFIK